MLRVESNTKLEGFTEYEEDILFEDDDPDFDHDADFQSILFKGQRNMLFSQTTTITLSSSNVPATMSLASVHPAELRSSHNSLTALSHSLDDITQACWSPPNAYSDHVLTIEELRDQLNCCFSCGVSWAESHVSLDCSECGGYAMDRPCMGCDGSCGAVWKRDLSMSHASGKAKWTGACARDQSAPRAQSPPTSSADQELSSRLEKLSANS